MKEIKRQIYISRCAIASNCPLDGSKVKLQQRRPREEKKAHGIGIKRARREKTCDVYTTKMGKIGRDILHLQDDPERFH